MGYKLGLLDNLDRGDQHVRSFQCVVRLLEVLCHWGREVVSNHPVGDCFEVLRDYDVVRIAIEELVHFPLRFEVAVILAEIQ